MTQKTSTPKTKALKNPYETLKNTSTSRGYDQLMDDSQTDEMGFMEQFLAERQEKSKAKKQRQEFSLFRYQEYHEGNVVKKQIAELTDQIKQELHGLKKASSDLLNEAKEVEKTVINPLPEKPGIYHIRFLEILLKLVRTIRLKIGESSTWLEAMTTKRKKRGSLFMSLTKKKGTQYSLSQELQTARSVQ